MLCFLTSGLGKEFRPFAAKCVAAETGRALPQARDYRSARMPDPITGLSARG